MDCVLNTVASETTRIIPKLTENARAVLRARYFRKDKNGKPIEDTVGLFWRVACCAASAERLYGNSAVEENRIRDQFYELMARGVFLPNSPTLMNAGREQPMMSACYVLPVPDSIEEIFAAIKNAALIQKAGGGTGFDFSSLRPRGDRIASSGGTTSGPVSFIRVFASATGAIQQGASRRGANMGVMRVDHPSIIELINAKCALHDLTNFNLSVALTDDFMERVMEHPDEHHIVRNPRNGQHSLLRREDGTPWLVKEVFDLIVQRAWETGEPGVIFIDHVNADNPTPHIGIIVAVNPCGEQPLLPYESCNLGSLNLAMFLEHSFDGITFDFDAFSEAIAIAVRFLDNIIDVNYYPLRECEEIAKGNRKIGLGVMGLADVLFAMRLPYDSIDATQLGSKIAKVLGEKAHEASSRLASERGNFPNWEGSIWCKRGIPMRNASATTIAPTGSISIIAGCSAGIEPLYGLVFERNILNGQKMREVNKEFEWVAKQRGFYSEELIREIYERGTIRGMEAVPEDVQQIFVTAHDIEPTDHVEMQSIFQKHCDAAVSKTVNLRNEATNDDVRSVFMQAFHSGCKGVTVYRDGCRADQPMSTLSISDKEGDAPSDASESPEVTPVALPEIMPAVRVRQATPFGNMHVKIVIDPQTRREMEVFAQLGKGGDLANSDLEAICRLTSLYLRVNGSLEDVMAQLEGIGSSFSIPTKDGRISSLADGLYHALTKYAKARKEVGLNHLLLGEPAPDSVAPGDHASPQSGQADAVQRKDAPFRLKCECGADLIIEEGCIKCSSCSYAEC